MNTTFTNDTFTNATDQTARPMWHTSRDDWIVAGVMIGCVVFITVLILFLFSNSLRKTGRALGYYAHILYIRVCCLPFQCCWTAHGKWSSYMNRRMIQLERDIRDADLEKTSYDSDLEKTSYNETML